VRKTNTTGGKGNGKKLMIPCNGGYRGKKNASMRKHADLPMVTKAKGIV